MLPNLHRHSLPFLEPHDLGLGDILHQRVSPIEFVGDLPHVARIGIDLVRNLPRAGGVGVLVFPPP